MEAQIAFKERPEGGYCKCGRKAVFSRKYEGSYLCKHHFCLSIEKKAKRTIRQHNMIKSGDRICVALSGGKDSSAVLYILSKVLNGRKDIDLFAVSIDEGIHGYRPESLEIAAKFCEQLGVKHRTLSFKAAFGKSLDEKMGEVAADPSMRIRESCTYCGVGRRYLMNRMARLSGATKLCTGHNLDDEAQAVLLNYIRGDLFRASRMGPVTDWSIKKESDSMFIPRIKPFREIPEREVALYAILKGLDIHMDECPNVGGIRFEARDFLNNLEAKYPGIKFTVLETFDKLLPAIRQVAEGNEPRLLRCRICGEPASREVCKTCELWRL
ncbi:MAG: TIGR00269 family protein [Candidatus Aenigmarchaeota archaeon]|nr:TIGR00269 family protein [Candidatus Aenigmarchaeota archaeon]